MIDTTPLVTAPDRQTPELQALAERLRPFYQRLAAHRLYRAFETLEDLHLFMQQHVYAVWDFMSLLKTLQRGLTCVEVPWTPSRFPQSRRLINEIVLGEESDVYNGRAASHFELYLEAMRACGADTSAIAHMIALLGEGREWKQAMHVSGASSATEAFCGVTFEIIAEGKLHTVAAAFTFGREDLIPDMFRGFIRDQDKMLSGRLHLFRWYLDRHIEVDGDEHGPMALRMISELCGEDERRWQEAGEAAERALDARIAFWDAIATELEDSRLTLATSEATKRAN